MEQADSAGKMAHDVNHNLFCPEDCDNAILSAYLRFDILSITWYVFVH